MFSSFVFWRCSMLTNFIAGTFYSSFISFIHQWLHSTLLGPSLFFSFVIFFAHPVGLLGRGISPSQGHCLHTGQHKHRINAHNTDIHALSGNRTHDPSVWAGEDSSCLSPRGRPLWSVYFTPLSDIPSPFVGCFVESARIWGSLHGI
jgi:hypothetical protein